VLTSEARSLPCSSARLVSPANGQRAHVTLGGRLAWGAADDTWLAMQVAEPPAADAGPDENMSDAHAEAGAAGEAAANGAPGEPGVAPPPAGGAADGESRPMEAAVAAGAAAGPAAEEEVEVVKKKRTKKLAVPYAAKTAGLSEKAVQVRPAAALGPPRWSGAGR